MMHSNIMLHQCLSLLMEAIWPEHHFFTADYTRPECVCVCVCLQEARCGYAIILMALYWCTECMPLPVTALLPVVLFPMMGIMKAADVLDLCVS